MIVSLLNKLTLVIIGHWDVNWEKCSFFFTWNSATLTYNSCVQLVMLLIWQENAWSATHSRCWPKGNNLKGNLCLMIRKLFTEYIVTYYTVYANTWSLEYSKLNTSTCTNIHNYGIYYTYRKYWSLYTIPSLTALGLTDIQRPQANYMGCNIKIAM